MPLVSVCVHTCECVCMCHAVFSKLGGGGGCVVFMLADFVSQLTLWHHSVASVYTYVSA